MTERQLALTEGGSVSAVQNFAGHLDGRKRMMQECADYLDTLGHEKADHSW